MNFPSPRELCERVREKEAKSGRGSRRDEKEGEEMAEGEVGSRLEHRLAAFSSFSTMSRAQRVRLSRGSRISEVANQRAREEGWFEMEERRKELGRVEGRSTWTYRSNLRDWERRRRD